MSTIAQEAFQAGFGPYMVCVAPPIGRPGPGASQRDMGKMPAFYRPATKDWVPLGVPRQRCEDFATAGLWDQLGANIGLKCGAGWNLAFVDLDIDDPYLVALALEVLCQKFGLDIPIRGVDDPNHHRVGVALRVRGVLRGATITFQDFIGDIHKIQVLADNLQFVAWGLHPGTRAPYVWQPQDPREFGPEGFPEVELSDLKDALDEIEEAFKAEGARRVSGRTLLGVTQRPSGEAGRIEGSYEEVQALLELIPNDDKFAAYDDWTWMCFALINASGGASWARDLWVQWSNQIAQGKGSSYPAQKWDENLGIPPKHLGVWWLRKEARARAPARTAAVDFDQHPVLDTEIEATALATIGKPIVPVIFSQWAYCPRETKFFSFKTGEFYPKEGFNDLYSPYLPKLKHELKAPKKGRLTPAQLFIDYYPERTIISQVTYHPGEGVLIDDGQGGLSANRWKLGFRTMYPGTTDIDVMPFIAHAKLVLRDDTIVAWFLKWCAYVVQFPNRKPNWAMLISTRPGLGKDFLIRALIHAVGLRNHKSVTVDALSSSFNDYLVGKLMTVSEARQSSQSGGKSNFDIYNELKHYLARPPDHISINDKNTKRFTIPNLSAWVFLSNHQVPLFIEQDDRRLLVVQNMDTPRASDDYYVRLKAYLDDNLDLIASYFMEYPLTQADIQLIEGQAPSTAAKQALMAHHRDQLEVGLEDIIEEARASAGQNKAHPRIAMVTTVDDLQSELRSQSFDLRALSRNRIVSLLLALGARPVRADPKGGGAASIWVKDRTRRLWLLAPTDDKGRDYTQLSESDLKDLFTGGRFPALDTVDPDANVVNLRTDRKHRDNEV